MSGVARREGTRGASRISRSDLRVSDWDTWHRRWGGKCRTAGFGKEQLRSRKTRGSLGTAIPAFEVAIRIWRDAPEGKMGSGSCAL
jgi:hypothetical protein